MIAKKAVAKKNTKAVTTVSKKKNPRKTVTPTKTTSARKTNPVLAQQKSVNEVNQALENLEKKAKEEIIVRPMPVITAKNEFRNRDSLTTANKVETKKPVVQNIKRVEQSIEKKIEKITKTIDSSKQISDILDISRNINKFNLQEYIAIKRKLDDLELSNYRVETEKEFIKKSSEELEELSLTFAKNKKKIGFYTFLRMQMYFFVSKLLMKGRSAFLLYDLIEYFNKNPLLKKALSSDTANDPDYSRNEILIYIVGFLYEQFKFKHDITMDYEQTDLKKALHMRFMLADTGIADVLKAMYKVEMLIKK